MFSPPTLPFQPFDDDESSLTIGEITFENHPDRIVSYGNQTFTVSPQSLEDAKALAQTYSLIANRIQQQLELNKLDSNNHQSSTQPIAQENNQLAQHGHRPNPFKL